MGQDPSTQRLANEAECFRRKILLVRPPPRLLARLNHPAAASAASSGSAHSTFVVRFLRSVAVSVVVWNGAPLLPEHWHHVFGNQNAVVYFFSQGDVKREDAVEVFAHTVAKIEEASSDPFMCSSFITRVGEQEDEAGDVEAAGTYSGSRSPKGSKRGTQRIRNAMSGEDVTIADPDTSDEDEGPVDKPSDRLRDISHAAGVRFFPLDSDEDEYALQCLVAAQFCPPDISRPLWSLLYQLVESCSATEAHLLDSVTLLPVQTTAESDVALGSPLNRLCWVLKDSLRRFAKAGKRVESCSCLLATGNRSVYLGWASEPLLYVVLVVDDQPGQCVGPALVQKNMEFFSMHFYNVVSNTTTKRQYAPMM
jgi:hypothetical protein